MADEPEDPVLLPPELESDDAVPELDDDESLELLADVAGVVDDELPRLSFL